MVDTVDGHPPGVEPVDGLAGVAGVRIGAAQRLDLPVTYYPRPARTPVGRFIGARRIDLNVKSSLIIASTAAALADGGVPARVQRPGWWLLKGRWLVGIGWRACRVGFGACHLDALAGLTVEVAFGGDVAGPVLGAGAGA